MSTSRPRTFFACLWKGEDLPDYSNDQYSVEDVLRLYKGLMGYTPNSRLVVLADTHYYQGVSDAIGPDTPGLHVELMSVEDHKHGGWTPMLEALSPAYRYLYVGGRAVLIGLDSVVVGDCSWMFEWEKSIVGLPRDPIFPNTVCNAVTTFDVSGASVVWSEYQRHTSEFPHKLFGRASEMELLRHLWFENSWKILDDGGGHLCSYKCDDVAHRGLPNTASVVYFHGRPKLKDLDSDNFVRRLWEHGSL